MQLPGRLSATTLGDLLGRLHRARATGVLELIEMASGAAGRSHCIVIERGLVARVDTPIASPRLVEILEQQGALTPHSATQVVGAARVSGRATGGLLLERQVVSAEQIARALRQQVKLRLEPLFRIADAQIRFHVPRPQRLDPTAPAPLTAAEFLHGRARSRAATQSGASRGHDALAPSGPWGVLGIAPGASPQEIKRAFRRLAAETHPDRFPFATEAERLFRLQRFSRLTSAYHHLMAS